MHPATAPIALLCSVPLEAAPVLSELEDGEEHLVGRRPAWSGRLRGRQVLLLVCGMGKTNAAQALTALLEHRRCAAVVGFGVAGSYPGSGPPLGGVVLADSAVYADEGVEAPSGWLSPREIGIPLLEVDGERYYDRFAPPPERVAAAAGVLRDAGIAAAVGPVATVSTCSGTRGRAELLAGRHPALCEAMEGAAWAHVARLYRTPWLELRGISNLVEDRDPSRWRLDLGTAAAAAAVLALLEGWNRID
jgi:futalosine hydrolase